MKKSYALFAVALMSLSMSATTIYCKMTQSWWTKDGAAVGIYFWGVSGAPEWPGIRMTSVGDGVWSYDLPAGVGTVIFSRVNGSGAVADWGAKTKDLTLPTDGKNLFTITTSIEVWGDPGCDGEWSVYDGQGGGQGGQGGGQGGGTGVEGNPRFYYKMYTKSDDTWHEPSEETIFDHGVAEVIDYTGDAYVFVLFQVDGQGGVQYRTEEFMDATHRSVKLVKEGPKDWQLPAGVTNLYLYDDGNDTYTLSADPIPGKKLADPQPVNQGIDETAAPTKARKVIIDGQLRILRGDKVFDATGRQIE